LIPPQLSTQFASGFFQDEIRLTNSLFLTVGSKLEHNAFTGFEYEPGAQLVWTPSTRHTLWTSAARAIRQPNVGDVNVHLNLGVTPPGGLPGLPDLPALLTISGNSSVKAEQLFDYEAGYRGQITPRLGLDLSTFLGYYRDLESFEVGVPSFVANPGQAPYLLLPLSYGNLVHGRKYGAELFFHWAPVRRWTLSPGYSFLQMSAEPLPGSTDFFSSTISGGSPKHQIQVRSVVRLRANVDWNATIRYVSRLPTPNIDAYVSADTTVRWRLRDDLEVSVTGQNLLSPGRLEFVQPVLTNSLVQRSVFAKMTWRF
jgi:iron complex outermembrane receptor protein